ncbi:MAG: hypothetical protein EBT78_16545 [Betaproteobacteria bacterium]|nr:hypothetical protein [Betaproteobacteria bacterium]NBT69359.1 hypothetical protein [Betaproteobacteria bacterium]
MTFIVSNEYVLPVDYRALASWQRRQVREQYVREQDGKCSHCQEPLSGNASKEVMSKPLNKRLFPENFFKHPVHLHHSHENGMTIGAVHCHCNAVLWQYHGE